MNIHLQKNSSLEQGDQTGQNFITLGLFFKGPGEFSAGNMICFRYFESSEVGSCRCFGHFGIFFGLATVLATISKSWANFFAIFWSPYSRMSQEGQLKSQRK